jgi:DNA-binding NarL/FixJ family response regulator
MKIKLLVVDDHEVIRTGLKNLLAGSSIEIVAEAANGKEALAQAEKYRPDVILLDVRMPDEDGLVTLERLRTQVPDSRVVMLSAFDNPTYVARAVVWGASDYLLKGSSRENLIAAIEAAAAGASPSDFGEIRRMADTLQSRRKVDEADVPITQREIQVLRHLALGLSNKEIARSLQISIETVKEHVQNILRKIAAKDRTQAAVWAVRKGLV